MKYRYPLSLAAATGLLWIIPSVGTQGMGTIGQRVAHPDAFLFGPSVGRAPLARADHTAESALGF